MAVVVKEWFNSEVYLWRSIAAASWAVVTAPLLVLMFVVLAGVSITHPFSWMNDCLTTLFSFQFFVSTIVLACLLGLIMRFSLPHYSVTAAVERTSLSWVLSLCQWSRLPLLVVDALSGVIAAWSLLRLTGSEVNSLTSVLDTKDFTKIVLNEKHLFLVEAGIFFGVCQYVRFFWNKHNYFAFPHTQRHKLFHIQKEAIQVIYSCASKSIKNTFIFYTVYFFFGGATKHWIKQSFRIEENPLTYSLTSILGLLDLGLLWQAYILSVVLTTGWTLAQGLVRVFHTQLLEFEVQNPLEGKQQCCLSDAMECVDAPLLQHLAFYDFLSVSRSSKQRRQELLTLSQPGGHPRVWMSVSRSAMHATRELTLKIQESNRTVMSRVGATPQAVGADIYSSAYITKSDIGNISTNGDSGNMSFQAIPPPPKVRFNLSNIPFMAQLMTELPDSASRQLFAGCQKHIWAVEGLSHMASKSYSEDKYGVVQGCLPGLISALLDLHEAIEKHFKVTSLPRRPANYQTCDAALPHRLLSVTRTAIYRVVNTYTNHIDDLHLSPEYRKKVAGFSDFLI